MLPYKPLPEDSLDDACDKLYYEAVAEVSQLQLSDSVVNALLIVLQDFDWEALAAEEHYEAYVSYVEDEYESYVSYLEDEYDNMKAEGKL